MTRPRFNGQVNFTIDPTMYEDRYALPLEVYGDLGRAVRTDLHYHYSTPVCAQRWLNVCDDPAYGHTRLLEHVDAVFPRVSGAVREDLGHDAPVHFTSLGPGDGAMDLRMLRSLATDFTLGSYRALDFSFELLRRAVNRIAGADGLKGAFSIHAICGDFTDLSAECSTTLQAEGSRIFSLMGFTLGNYEESGLLREIGALMGPDDYLLLDARLHRFGRIAPGSPLPHVGREAWTSSYNIPSVRDFVFGPVEVATEAVASDVKIDFEIARTLTSVPSALNVVIYCTDLGTRMRLTGEAVQQDRLDLAVTTAYDFDDLRSWFPEVGLSLRWSQRMEEVGFFLLTRRPAP